MSDKKILTEEQEKNLKDLSALAKVAQETIDLATPVFKEVDALKSSDALRSFQSWMDVVRKAAKINKEIRKKIRADVIEDQIQIEADIDSFLSNYFGSKKSRDAFLFLFLMNRSCSSGLKMQVLAAIGMKKNLWQKLHVLSNARNALAHGMPFDLFMAQNIIFDGKKSKFRTVDEIFDEYKKSNESVKKQLQQELKRLQKERQSVFDKCEAILDDFPPFPTKTQKK